MPDRPSRAAIDPLDAFTSLEADRACENTRLKQGMNRTGEKKVTSTATLLTLGAFQP